MSIGDAIETAAIIIGGSTIGGTTVGVVLAAVGFTRGGIGRGSFAASVQGSSVSSGRATGVLICSTTCLGLIVGLVAGGVYLGQTLSG